MLVKPTWRNGRRAAFRSQSLHGGVGSNPIVGTNFSFLYYFSERKSLMGMLCFSAFSSGTERHKFNPFIKIGEDIENDIHRKVANDAVKAYELAVKGGDKIEIAVCAGFVVAAYRQANDEANYLRWKEIEKYAKKAAGLSW